MELSNAIEKRRSIRRFKSDPVPREEIIEILRAANMAPSATNSMPWSFIVLDKADLNDLHKITGEAFDERFGGMPREQAQEKLSRLSIPDPDKYRGLMQFYKTLGNAPNVIIVCVEQGGDEYGSLLNTSSAAAAVQNLLLAACDRGLGACWMMGPLQKKADALRDLIGLPDSQEILAIIPIGYPEKVPPAPQKQDVEEKIRWGI